MSQLKSETKTIGSNKFEVFMLSPLDAQDVLIDIGHILAPAIGKAAQAIGKADVTSPLDLDIDDPRISAGVAALLQGITKAKMRELIATMAGVSRCDGVPLDQTMEIVFRGNLALMYQWLWFALEVNFKNFTNWLGAGIKGVSGLAVVARSRGTSGDTGQQ